MRKITTKRFTALLLLFVFIFQTAPFVSAQQTAPQTDINARIRQEAMNNSQIMRTLHYFTDVYGPRLTGSPQHKAAADWAVQQMKTWGFDNAYLDPWDFGRHGWVNDRASGFITAPMQDNLTFEVLGWTPGTNGVVSGQAYNLILPVRPTQEELNSFFESIRAEVAGKMVLVGRPASIPVNFDPPRKRLDDDALRRQLDPSASPTPGPTPPPQPSPMPTPRAGQLSNQQIGLLLNQFLVDSNAAVRINDAGEEHGKIRAFSNSTYDVTKAIPTVVMRNEDFGRIARLLASKIPVTLEFDIRNRTFPEGATSYNVMGEIAGTDKKDEVIMLGGHLDAWHAATGATDNAIGCAVMMEAARILKALGVKPRRTIRVALWSGEEQGLLGSQAYVRKTFGTFENPTPAYEKFGGYFNIDSGTGRARAMTVFGPPEAASILRQAIAPFEDLGILGAATTRSRGLGGSDHTSFNAAGLPGIGILQDPIEYRTYTWHTNLDTYERVVEADAKASAAVIAAAVYELAMRDTLLPRLPREQMPPAPPSR
jgi:carboxypeptidase Q